MAFVSTVFLFPNDAGGKIRTTNVLRGLRGGAFDITLICPASEQQLQRWEAELRTVADRVVTWSPPSRGPRWARALDLLRRIPVNIAFDRTAPALRSVQHELAGSAFDVVVFDFVHAAVLRPHGLRQPTVCFTHNVEAEIFARHAKQATNPVMRWVWRSQHAKMLAFERAALRDFTAVVAVSERDAAFFTEQYGLHAVTAIPTGVDLDFFAWREPTSTDGPPTVVFTGSMDWAANVDGVKFFLSEVWPAVKARLPTARFVIVGRHPPAALIQLGRAAGDVEFTGFVDDVRPHVHGAQAFVIPLRVGGGTRIKAFEAMAMGCPVVSTSIGIEGLDVADGEHFLCRDGAEAMADAIAALLTNEPLRRQLSVRARARVEAQFGHRVAAAAFEQACVSALGSRHGASRHSGLASGVA
jgi:glycosyltransferase involved in cell wall biosynthesis